VHRELGNHAEAAAAYRSAATVADEIDDPVGAARAWQGLGEVYRLEGDFVAALRSLGTSLARWEKTADAPGKTSALFATGLVHAHLRAFTRAVEWYERAIESDRAIHDDPGIARDLGGLGGAHLALGRIDLAQAEYEQSLALREQLRDSRGVAWTLIHLAALHVRAARPDEAIRVGQRAVGAAERIGDRPGLCTAWAVIAGAQEAGGDLESALASADRAADLAVRIGQFDVLAHARTVSGTVHAKAGRPAEAQAALEEAVAALARVPVGPGADLFFDDRRAPYLALVDLFAGQGRDADAFAWLERGRRHLLAVMLGEDGVLVGKGLTAAEREEEVRLLRASRSAAVKLQREALRDRPDAERQARLREELASLVSAREALRERLFAAHPGLRALRARDDPAPAAPLPVLEPGEVAFAYSIGESVLRLFVVSSPAAGADPSAPPRVDLVTVEVAATDLAARVARFREAILARDPTVEALAADLDRLLVAPARAWLSPARHLLVVPDAFLWGLPFEALQSPAGRHLVEGVSISYLPSLASAAIYRQATGPAARPRLVAVAAPVVASPVQERLALARSGAPGPRPAVAAAEARAAAAIFGAGTRLLTGAEATAERLLTAAAGGQVLHLAVPALLDDASPFHSALVFSPAPAPDPESGLVEAATVMSWPLPAGLAVLSQAEPVQPRPAGDALTAWSWSFLVAGTPTIAVGRWPASATPARTDPLVRGFYRELLRAGRTRPSPARALQRAARRLLASPATSHPWFWARMMVMGR
jgi:CHAT domain-containing protein